MSKNVWIGLVNLVPKEGNNDLEGALGAYVNILAFAEDEESYKKLVEFAAYEHEYDVEEIKDVELFEKRVSNFEVEDDIKILAEKVKETEKTHFGEFYVYENEEDK
ncbi:MAG: hypothetical protein H6755_06360 [Candidatus Omnitrophica bacterium]|nr:hypothetical protein [Candidatus Omnitrophota bacterium]MCB9748011.1 hypothetical protein [Candidatus Omnitrophota bacterium]